MKLLHRRHIRDKFSKDGFRRHGKKHRWYATIHDRDYGAIRFNRLSGRFRFLRPPPTLLRRARNLLGETRLARFRRRR